jgi:hypothetical protein
MTILLAFVAGVLVAGFLLAIWVRSTRARNADPVQRRIADTMKEIFDGYSTLSMADQSRQSERYVSCLLEFKGAGVTNRQIAHSITMLNLLLSPEDMSQLREQTTQFVVVSK